MKAITLTQPWASLVAAGAKSIETRSWSTSYRGPLAIHAAKGLGSVGGARGLLELCKREPFAAALRQGGATYTDRLPLGAIVATCNLVAVERIVDSTVRRIGRNTAEYAFGDYTVGRYAWVLDDVAPLAEPIPCAGALSLWLPDWHPALAEAAAQLLDVTANGSARCSSCGCTDNLACDDGCGWANSDPLVCSSCVDKLAAAEGVLA